MASVDAASSSEVTRSGRSWIVTSSILFLGALSVVFSSTRLALMFVMLISIIGLLRILAFLFRAGLRRNVIRWRKVRITREALWFFFIVAGFSLASINTGYNLLCLITAMMLAFLLVSGILAEVSFKKLKVTRSLPHSVFAGEEFRVDVSIENNKRFVPTYALRVIDVEHSDAFAKEKPYKLMLKVGARSRERVTYSGKFKRRGRYVFNTCAVQSSFPFGFVEKTIQIPCRGEITVYPRVRPLREPQIIGTASTEELLRQSIRVEEGEEDFHGLREYRPGDNPRLIHWKTTARTGKPFIKEFERRRARRALIILDTSAGEEELPESLDVQFERAVELAASLAGHFTEKGFGVAFAAMTPSATLLKAASGRRRLYDILEKLARVGRSRNDSLIEIARAIPQSDLRTHMVFVVSPGKPDEAAVKILRAGQPYMRVLSTESDASGGFFSRGGGGAA
ncbi:MAG: DUF58 domain-containing protein [Planctomycetota bacterium]|jgi:uncharacterized protein (DUF58 family)